MFVNENWKNMLFTTLKNNVAYGSIYAMYVLGKIYQRDDYLHGDKTNSAYGIELLYKAANLGFSGALVSLGIHTRNNVHYQKAKYLGNAMGSAMLGHNDPNIRNSGEFFRRIFV